MSFNPTNEDLLQAADEAGVTAIDAIVKFLAVVTDAQDIGYDVRQDAGEAIAAWGAARQMLGDPQSPGQANLSAGLAFATEIYARSVIAEAPLSLYGVADVCTRVGTQLVIRGAAAGEPWALAEIEGLKAFVAGSDPEAPEVRRLAAEYGIEI